MATKQSIAYLMQQRLENRLSPEEKEELSEILADKKQDAAVKELLQQYMEQQTLDQSKDVSRWDEHIAAIINIDKQENAPVRFLHNKWFRYAAAAVILFGIGAYLWNIRKQKSESAIVQSLPSKTDVLPGGNHAILTLANGTTIKLDSAANGQLTTQGNSSIIKTRDGQLVYNIDHSGSPPPLLKGGTERSEGSARSARSAGGFSNTGVNTMSTPRGGQYQLTLSDGTRVWLNAASSITYPVAFVGKERRISITGEAYFEVAKNKEQPFIVHTAKDDITVLGTSFNVNAYLDELFIKTSLIDGSVKINDKILQPGNAYLNGKIVETNVSQDIAWKNGVFQFDHATMPAVFRQLCRWYDIQVVYEKDVPAVLFSGKMLRNLTLGQVVKILNDMEVKCELDSNRRLLVH